MTKQTAKHKHTELELKKIQMRRKRRKNRMKRRFMAFLFMFVCALIIITVLKAPVFNVRSIVCVGQETLSEKEIIAAAGAKTGENIFISNISRMKRQVAEIPKVAQSNVRRLFPNRIKIWVREAKDAAFIETQSGGYLVTDINARILYSAEKEDERLKTLVKISGAEVASKQVGTVAFAETDANSSSALECLKALEKHSMLDGTRLIDVSKAGTIVINYEDRLRIILGSFDDLDYKLKFINKVKTENLSELERAELDFTGDKLYAAPLSENSGEADKGGEGAKAEDKALSGGDESGKAEDKAASGKEDKTESGQTGAEEKTAQGSEAKENKTGGAASNNNGEKSE